ncbi:MAG: DUF2723 domain-containing protein [Chloroflexi bacterium]|nr:DUF2723 domain-containing protein [Chloroflexota bacterium]
MSTKPFFDFRLLDRRGWIALGLLLALASALYLSTLDNGLTPGNLEGGDLITHQYAQVQARPSNAPGYPLYTLGGWLWFHGLRLLAPQANPIPLLSSYSTLWSLLALAVLFILLYKLSRGRLVISVGLTVYYAVTYFFWFYSVTTEQYTSAVLQTLLIVAVVMAWDRDPRDGYLYLLAFLLGLSLAHLVTVLFIAPGVLLFVLSKEPALLRRPRLVFFSALLALLPLTSYLFIYLRGAQHPEWRGVGAWPSTWAWFLDFVSTKQGREELTWTLGPFTDEFPRLIWQEISPVLLALGAVGWWRMGRRYAVMFGLTAVIYLVFSYIDRYGNWYQVIMPLHPLILLGAGAALTQLWDAYSTRLWRVVLTLILAALILLQFTSSYPRADQRNRPDDMGLEPGRAILASKPPANAAILGSVEEKLALDYLTIVWGVRPDVRAITTPELKAALATGHPVLLTVSAASFAAAESGLPLRYSSWGPGLLLVSTDAWPRVPLEGLEMVDVDLGDGLRLAGYSLQPSAGPGLWDVKLAFAVDVAPQQNWSISLRLLENGVELAQQDHIALAEGYAPTTALRAGDIVFDAFRFHLDPTARPDAFRLILYRQLANGRFENLVDITIEASSVGR